MSRYVPPHRRAIPIGSRNYEYPDTNEYNNHPVRPRPDNLWNPLWTHEIKFIRQWMDAVEEAGESDLHAIEQMLSTVGFRLYLDIFQNLDGPDQPLVISSYFHRLKRYLKK